MTKKSKTKSQTSETEEVAPKEKKTETLYFGPDVDNAIVLFKLEKEIKEKHKVFLSHIKPAFEKLILYHYYKTPIARNPEIMKDCLSFLYEQIEKFDALKHQRGFPYFNVITKNYFIQKIKTEKKQISNDQYSISLSDYQAQKGNIDALVEDLDEKIEQKEFIESVKSHLPKWRDQFTKPQEKVFVDALITLFENSENIDIYSKKAIFFYLKEITSETYPPDGLNSKQIATNLEKIKKKFLMLRKKYQRGDV